MKIQGFHFFNSFSRLALLASLSAVANFCYAEEEAREKHQYIFEDIKVLPASAEEPLLDHFSPQKADAYLAAGATAWTKEKNCISCHTNGSYLLLRPALTDTLGKPDEKIRDFYVSVLEKREAEDPEKLKNHGVTPSELALLAAGLAEWDAHVTHQLSEETRRALTLMFKVQEEDGSFANDDCWPPFESSDYLSATVAAMAAATAPGYLDSIDAPSKTAYDKLIAHLKENEPVHDYASLQLLWTATRVEGLISTEQQKAIIEMIFSHQRPDGGWAIRTFAAPDAWGGGNREDKLLEEPDIENPPSEGYQTGLAVVVLRDAGVPVEDPRLQKAAAWIKNNQRESGRWWTRSLNNDKFHFITYSGTLLPLLALEKTNQLPPLGAE